MKKLLIIVLVLFLANIFMSEARGVTIKFSPNDLIDLYPASAGDENVPGETMATQLNARRFSKDYAAVTYETFYNPEYPHTQPNDYNTCLNWRDGLGANEGISGLYTFISFQSTIGPIWGAKLVCKESSPEPTITADGGGNWSAYVIVNEPGMYGLKWETADSSYYLRPNGPDLGDFTFTAELYWDSNDNGYDAQDAEVLPGDIVRNVFYNNVEYDMEGWGGRDPSYGPFSHSVGDAYMGTLNAQAVPEPSTIMMFSSCFLGVFSFIRKAAK